MSGRSILPLQFLYHMIDPSYKFSAMGPRDRKSMGGGKARTNAVKASENMVETIPVLLKALGYPFKLNRSTLISCGSHSNWPKMLGALHFLLEIVTVRTTAALGLVPPSRLCGKLNRRCTLVVYVPLLLPLRLAAPADGRHRLADLRRGCEWEWVRGRPVHEPAQPAHVRVHARGEPARSLSFEPRVWSLLVASIFDADVKLLAAHVEPRPTGHSSLVMTTSRPSSMTTC